jgi:hypothetical protein
MLHILLDARDVGLERVKRAPTGPEGLLDVPQAIFQDDLPRANR